VGRIGGEAGQSGDAILELVFCHED
jgi:hypothetical protein